MKSGFTTTAIPSITLALALGSISLMAQAPSPAGVPDTTGTTTSAPTIIAPPPDNGQRPADPALTVRSDKMAQEAEPPANEEYTLGPGDQISLDFPGRTELAGKHTVGPDGRITLPLAGPVHVAGLSRIAAGKAIVDSLSTFYTDLSVTVSIDKYTSNRVRVLGYVQHPGEIYFDETPTLLDAISKAGLISPTVSKEGRTVAVGSGIPEICTIFRGDSTTYQVQLRSLLMSGNALADMRLRRNDIIFVPEPKEEFVSVLGEVTRPGTIPLTPASTLTSVLSEAGCCSEGGGFSPKVHIIQPSTGKTFDVPYKKLMTIEGQKEYTLHTGDVIIIPKSGFFKATYVFQRVSPVTSLIGLAAVAAF
jgi:polysaccharide export outer membrane protein